jgi:acetyltransferase-like isoleucine patch superfamily enzyme
MYQSLYTPWKIRNEIHRYFVWPRVWLAFTLAGIPIGEQWRIYGVPILQIHRQAHIQLGNRLQLRSSLYSNPLAPTHPVVLSVREADAQLTIGENFAMTGGLIVASKSIVIGNDVTIGANSKIIDTDFHPLDAQQRRKMSSGGASEPIRIENDVFIGMDCLILKGVTVGEGSIIGARSLVTSNIPPGVIAAGQPAKVLSTLDQER